LALLAVSSLRADVELAFAVPDDGRVTLGVFNDAGKLEGFFNQGVGFYRQFGIVGVRPDVWSRRFWSKKIMQVKVNWQYFDLNKKPIYNCDYHYVLKLDKNNVWKIILSVSENERERMEEWQRNSHK
jgi:hypothetical protein